MTEPAPAPPNEASPGDGAADAPVATPSAFSVFRKRDFRLLWSAQLVSTVGTALTDLAAGILVFRHTGSALSVGLMFMAVSIPTLVVGLIAGVFVDRYDRRKIMVIADLLRAAIVVTIPFLISARHRLPVRRGRPGQHDLAVLQPGQRRPAAGGRDGRGARRGELVDHDQLVRVDLDRLRPVGPAGDGVQHRLGVLPGRR